MIYRKEFNLQIATYAETKRILKEYGLTARKSMGQNFLIDLHVLNKTIKAAGITSDDEVLEIGPGIGGLTQPLLQSAKSVLAVEIDKKLSDVLKIILPAVEVVNADILDFTIPKHINKVVANLPYYITTPVVMHLLENYCFESITVMVQKEVAQRMAAAAGSKAYGALSLAVQYHATVYIAANVPPNCFFPRPNVSSCVVRLDTLKTPPVTTDKTALFTNIRAGFGQRRKTLVNSLFSAETTSLSKDELAAVITSCGFSEKIRGEELTLQDWGRLTEALL